MKVNHLRLFLSALRTAIILVTGFIAYEILKEVEKIWNQIYPNKIYNFSKRKLYKLFIIFIIDIILLYIFFYVFKIEL